jgi:hypothetical protein
MMSLAALNLSAQNDKDFAQLNKAMAAQLNSWNRGDVESFMEAYWKSEKMQFIGKSGVQYGWQATLERYKRSYPNAAKMGKLQFDVKSHDKIDKKTILTLGQWRIDRIRDDGQPEVLEGWFSLIWQYIGKKWVIIADHSS